jgi:Domain of unknown function (DUF4145)
MAKSPFNWSNLSGIPSMRFTCGYCGNLVASDRGYHSTARVQNEQGFLCICPHCERPTFLHGDRQIPGVSPGAEVGHLPQDIQALYTEARRCTANSNFTAAVLVCRKLLMNIAVSRGADPGKKFIEYVDYLADKGYVPPNGRGWVDHIRTKGNEATHEIVLMSKTDADELITFAEMLLKFIYEFPARVPPKKV